ncbi:MAG: aminotransferase class I/II-fold pyridoxal phosphate-dependent enzyme [Promethearchaeia archaeon]
MDFTLLKTTPLYDAFSELGKRIYLPDGIFHWSGRAKKEAELIGTIGTAYGFEKDFVEGGSEEWMACYLEDINEYSSLTSENIVPYASIGGLSEMREFWKDWITNKSGYDKEREQEKIEFLKTYITTPLITSGITNAIFVTCSLFLDQGEYILSPNKRWGNYNNIISKNIGAKIKSFDFFKDKRLNIQGIKNAIKDLAKEQEKIVLILNFPNNPTGYVPSPAEAEELVISLREIQQDIKKPIIVLVDDAYEPYIYTDEVINTSIFYDLLELKGDIIPIKLDGISKELFMYGGRIGSITIGLKKAWVANEEELETLKTEINNKLEGLNRSSISNSNRFYQALTVKMFKEKGIDKIVQHREKIRRLLKARYEKINEELNQIHDEKISVDPNAGGFFVFANLDPEKVKATEFADLLLKKYKVGVIPIEKPEININGIRIAYCSIDLQKIPEFVDRIKEALKDFD